MDKKEIDSGTSGFCATDWTTEEAMSFVMTGGINAPDSARYSSRSGKDGV
ncbi:MAG: hypothetical protein WA056_02555 [Gallionella sp.]